MYFYKHCRCFDTSKSTQQKFVIEKANVVNDLKKAMSNK